MGLLPVIARIHQNLRVTPAMEAGVSDHVWSLEKVIALFAHAISENTPKADEQDIVAKTGVGSDSTELRGAGTWHIKVDSANADWSLEVEEFR